ncbi:MAG: hypothetical protein IH983_05205 [Planctomycetes bacterium]|nr:hypothetical protein [Planctomycetota bacterium]
MRHRKMATAGLVLAGTMMAVYGLAAFTGGVAGFPIFAFGLPHAPVGQAVLNLDKLGNLVVSNIGPSGADGVAVNFGPADGVELHLLGGPLAGSLLQLAANGKVNGLPNQDLGHIGMVTLPEGYISIDPDFSPIGVNAYTIEVYLAGELVHTQVQTGPTAIVPQLPHGLSVFLDQAQGGAAGNDVAHDVIWDLHFPIATSIQIVAGPTVIGDLLRLIYPPDPVIVGSTDGLYITAADSGQLTLTISSERLIQFSNPHEALGQAHMIGFDPPNLPPQLIVSNIGCCGQDGVSIDLAGAVPREPVIPSAAVHLSIPNVSAAGAYVDAAASVMGIDPTPFLVGSSRASNVSNVGVLNSGIHVEVTADFTPIGANTFTVQLFNSLGELVTEVMGVIDPVVINVDNLNVSIIGHMAAHAHGQFDWGLTSVQLVTISGQPPEPCDEIRLIAEGPGGIARGPLPDLVSIDLTAAGIGSFTITDETVEVLSTADIAGPLGAGFPDGCVDAFDLGTLLGAWCSAAGDPDPAGDVDPPCEGCVSPNFALADISGPGSPPNNPPDGCVDPFDLAKLLAEWCSVAGGNPCGTCGP